MVLFCFYGWMLSLWSMWDSSSVELWIKTHIKRIPYSILWHKLQMFHGRVNTGLLLIPEPQYHVPRRYASPLTLEHYCRIWQKAIRFELHVRRLEKPTAFFRKFVTRCRREIVQRNLNRNELSGEQKLVQCGAENWDTGQSITMSTALPILKNSAAIECKRVYVPALSRYTVVNSKNASFRLCTYVFAIGCVFHIGFRSNNLGVS